MDQEFEKLTLYFAEEIFNNADKQTNKAYKIQKKDQDNFLNVIARILLSYTIIDSVLKLTDNEKIILRKDLNATINNISLGQYKAEKNLMNDILKDCTIDKYYSDAYVMNVGLDFKLHKLTDEQIKKVVDEAIKGEVWSDRLWTNKKSLENDLKHQIEQFLQGRTTVNNIEKVIKDSFNQSAYNTKRLVQTEVSRCQSSVNDVFAMEHDVQEQIYTATLDKKTSNFCREHDGITYKIDDSEKPKIPVHPHCRSVYINVPFKGWKPKVRKDNETKEIINYKTYEDWLKEKNIKK